MRINQSEIIEEMLEHIRQLGGGFSEWCVGTAKDSQAPFLRRHVGADLGDGLISREAYTTYAADEVVDRLAKGCGLHLDRDAVPEPGKIVFVYRKTPPAPSLSPAIRPRCTSLQRRRAFPACAFRSGEFTSPWP